MASGFSLKEFLDFLSIEGGESSCLNSSTCEFAVGLRATCVQDTRSMALRGSKAAEPCGGSSFGGIAATRTVDPGSVGGRQGAGQ